MNIDNFNDILMTLNDAVKGLPEPDFGTVDGITASMACFDNGDDHLEFEFADNQVEVFYLKRSTNAIWEQYYDGFVSNELKELLTLFCIK